MIYGRQNLQFPTQRVDWKIREKAEWYANCIDFIIQAGVNCNDREEDELKLSILYGNIPDKFYKKILNPYNATKEQYTRFPATMRNLDIMNDIVRRYVSEYFKGIHEFIVTANDPSVVGAREVKIKEEIAKKAEEAFQKAFTEKYNQMLQESEAQGIEPKQLTPEEVVGDVDDFIKKIGEDYIDDKTEQGSLVYEYIKSMTKDDLIYLSAYFNFVTLGECFTYTDIRGDKIIKESVPVVEAYPIPNSEYFVEDHDMFARKIMMSYQQIIDSFDDYLTDKDRAFLEDYYNNRGETTSAKRLSYSEFFNVYSDVCEKFSKEERDLFRQEPITVYDINNSLYEVWHVVWRGESKRGILQHINEAGLIEETIVDETYKLNKEAGDLKIEWTYEPQVYEGYRIGGRYNAIYPIKSRAVAYNRKGKLPYNGIMEVLPLMGKFSIIKLITPYQIMRNIFAYHREMIIAKNKMLILLLPESLIASDNEDKLYKMAADGTLLIDDSEDTNSQKMAQIRMLNANMGDYITQITNLIEATKLEAREIVDMNAQRYGQISQSAGASTTQQAVAQSAMGSIIITTMFDKMREADYNRDMDYAKLAYIDGLDVSFRDSSGVQRYLSLDIDKFVNADYSVAVKTDIKEIDKLQQLKQWAFSAAQNGDLEMAIAAITGDNVTQIKTLVTKFADIKRQHEADMKQAEQMIEQQKIQAKLQEIQAKGEQDRLTEELKQQYQLQAKYIDVDISLLGTSVQDDAAKQRLSEIAEGNRNAVEQQKLMFNNQKLQADIYNKAADREVKLADIAAKVKIAKTNKNRFDKK